MTLVHVARFGERAGEHALLGHTGADRDLLTEAQFRSDVPPQGDLDNLGAFVAGYRLDDFYVVQRSTPDVAATRSGMVSTTSVLLPVKLLGSISLHRVLDYLGGAPEPTTPIDPAAFLEGDGYHTHPRGAPALASALLSGRRAIWPGGDGFADAVACLWQHLPGAERHRLTFGAAFHPGAINVPVGLSELVALSVPVTVLGRWQDWPLIDPSKAIGADPVRDALLDGDEVVHALGVDLLGREASFDEWRHLVNIEMLERELDTLDHERVRALLQLIGLIAPATASGGRQKARALARLADLTTNAAFDDVRGLRGLPWNALPDHAAADLVGAWAAAAMADSGRSVDVAEAVIEVVAGAADAFRDELEAGLRAALAGAEASTWQRCAAVLLDRGPELITWLIDSAPKPAVADGALAPAIDDRGGSSPPWLAPLAAARRLPGTHARTVDASNPIKAWRAHVALKRRPAAADAVLAARVGGRGTVAAALALDDASLTAIAADLVVETPSLLARRFVVTDRRAVGLWAESVARGVDPWSVISPAEAGPVLLDALLAGEASESLLDALSHTAAGDLSSYANRPDVWSKLQPEPRARMLAVTANSYGRSWRPGDPPVELPLAEAILEQDRLGAIAHDDPAHAVRLLNALAGAKPEHAVVVARRGRFDASGATELADLVVKRRWKRAAESIADLADGRPDLKSAASRVSVLFSTMERLRRWAGRSEGVRGVVTHGELRDSLHDLAASLYPAGPSDRGLWERAGGHAADCPDASTARHRWGLALTAVDEGHKGAPSLEDLLGVMRDEYPQNADLLWIAIAMLGGAPGAPRT